MEEPVTRGPEVAVRERLLKSAAELFARKGYASTTVREIVAAAGVTKPTLYYYFHNKEGIYLELLRGSLAQFESLLATARDGDGPVRGKILALCDRLMLLLFENIPVARIMYAIYYSPPQGAPFFDCDLFHFAFQDTIRKLVVEGIGRKEFRLVSETDVTWIVMGAVTLAVEMELNHPAVAPGRAGLKRMLTLIFNGLGDRDVP